MAKYLQVTNPESKYVYYSWLNLTLQKKNVKGTLNKNHLNLLGVSKNRGTPKSSILIGFSIINHPFWGTPIFGNIHMFPQQFRNLPTWKESCSNNSPRPKPGFFDGHQDAAWLPVANRP